MAGGFRNQPKILRGAFVEYGLSIPPLAVVFQFNPLQLSRSRRQFFSAPSTGLEEEGGRVMLRDFHQPIRDLTEVRDTQQVNMGPESLTFDIRLDATDQLNDGDRLAALFGIAPRLATLELMMEPKSESLMGKAVDIVRQALSAGGNNAFSFTGTQKPPLVLFIWGPMRVLPVNIDSLDITESEFSPTLVPTRATVTVNLTVIEGENPLYKYTKAIREQMSLLNLANAPDITDVIIPG